MADIPGFTGLSPQAGAFLAELGSNNNRDWYVAHRTEFDRLVAGPLAALAESIAPDMMCIDPALICRVSRPNRDVRFSKDRSPYRTTMWFAYRPPQSEWTDLPAYFFEATPDHCRWGMGYFEASPATMAALRDHVGEHQPTFLSAMDAATSRHFTLEGDPYKRLPTIPPDTPQPVADLVRRRNAYLCRVMRYGPALERATFSRELAIDFEALARMYGLFLEARSRWEPRGRRSAL